MFVAYMVVLTSGMFRLAELQILRSLLTLSRVSIGDRVYVQPYEKQYYLGRDLVFQHHPVPFRVSGPANDILTAFSKLGFLITEMSGLTIEYKDYYRNWIGRMQ